MILHASKIRCKNTCKCKNGDSWSYESFFFSLPVLLRIWWVNFDLNDVSFVALVLLFLIFLLCPLECNVSFFSSFILQKGWHKTGEYFLLHRALLLFYSSCVFSCSLGTFRWLFSCPIALSAIAYSLHSHQHFKTFFLNDSIQIGLCLTFVLRNNTVTMWQAPHPVKVKVKTRDIDISCKRLFFLYPLRLSLCHCWMYFLLFSLFF